MGSEHADLAWFLRPGSLDVPQIPLKLVHKYLHTHRCANTLHLAKNGHGRLEVKLGDIVLAWYA